ncbi:hypothetical protein [Synechococcus sp. PCC 7336]|uniref:hypothetical protein n=1 Tax=Synechococcus sp. PCC 7336 TaxID=195250 RepID=UPI0012EA9981|nr:hypothetical protein [Synechococcus sp. PCC 7336]
MMIKKFTLTVLIFVIGAIAFLNGRPSRADTVTPFMQLNCIPELGYLQVSAVTLANVGWQENYRKYGEMHGLYLRNLAENLDPIRVTCGVTEVEVTYGTSRAQGICGSAPAAALSFWLNGELILDGVRFHDNCLEDSVFLLTYDEGNSLELCSRSVGFPERSAVCSTKFLFNLDAGPPYKSFTEFRSNAPSIYQSS